MQNGMQIEELLNEVAVISKKYDLLYQKTGGCFNIFEIADISVSETTICRVLYELLSPEGSHYQGDTYLKLFVRNVLEPAQTERAEKISDGELRTAKVYREYLTRNNRRIDLVIKTDKRFIPIEVKIYAGEQRKQCYDYYQEAKGSSNLFYLTRSGAFPSEDSAEGLTPLEGGGYEEITPISFERDILDWLYLCIAQRETVKLAPIREVLLQLAATIRRFTNQMEDDKKMEMRTLLTQSSEKMRNAVQIKETLQDRKIPIEMAVKLFEALDNRISQKRLENEYDYLTNVERYYSLPKLYDAGISYLWQKDIKKDIKNVDIWIRMEIEYDGIYIGFCVTENGKKTNQLLSSEEIKKYLQGKERIGSWWIYWERIKDNQSRCPNFNNLNNLNDAYFDLFDEDFFKEFVDICVKKFEEFFKIGAEGAACPAS
jgi:hypothetical protein